MLPAHVTAGSALLLTLHVQPCDRHVACFSYENPSLYLETLNTRRVTVLVHGEEKGAV